MVCIRCHIYMGYKITLFYQTPDGEAAREELTHFLTSGISMNLNKAI